MRVHSLGAAHAMSTREGQKVLRDSFSGTTGLRLGGTKAVRWSRISFVLSALYCRVAAVLYTDVQNSRDSAVQHTISVQTPLRLHCTKVLYIGVVVQSGAPPPSRWSLDSIFLLLRTEKY